MMPASRKHAGAHQHEIKLAILFLMLLIGVFAATLVSADDDDRGHGNKRREHRGEGHRDWQRGWRRPDDANGYGYRTQRAYPNYYSQPVYVPPPVYYAPQQSPGISLFFPLDLR